MENIFLILFGITMLFTYASNQIKQYIKTITAQGILLFIIVLPDFRVMGLFSAIFLSIETLLVKAIIIPALLLQAIRKNDIKSEVEPYIPHLYSLVIETLIFIAGITISIMIFNFEKDIKPLYFGISISTIISSLFLIMNRKKIISHILGYIMMENGIFLLSLSLAGEMPFIVNLGVLLDIFIGIYIFVILLGKIQDTFDKDNIDVLTGLRD